MLTSKSLDYSQLFDLNDPLATRPLRLAQLSTWVHTPEAHLLSQGKLKPLEPVVFEAKTGGTATDFLWTQFPPLVCISERVVNILLDNRFTGWATYPVEVYGHKGELLPGYYGFAVKSSVGQRDLSRSQLVTKPPVVPGGKHWQAYRGIFFDEDKWDGSDIFRLGIAGAIIVTRQVKDSFVRAKITNVKLTPLQDVETDTIIYEVMRKHRESTS